MSSRKNYFDVLGGDEIDENEEPSSVFAAFAQSTLQPDSTAEQIADPVGDSESSDQLPMKPGAPRLKVVQTPKQFWRQPFNHLAVGPRNRTFPVGVRLHKNRDVPSHGRGILNHMNSISPSKAYGGFSGVHDERRGHNLPGVRNRADRFQNENLGVLLSGNERPNDLNSTNSHNTNNDGYPRKSVEGHAGNGFLSRSQRRSWYYHSFIKHRKSGKDGSGHKSENLGRTHAVSNSGVGTGGSGSCIYSDGIQVAGVDREVRPFYSVLGRKVCCGSLFHHPRVPGFESETKRGTYNRETEGSKFNAQLQAAVGVHSSEDILKEEGREVEIHEVLPEKAVAVAFKEDMLKRLSEQNLHPVQEAADSDNVTDREMTLDEYIMILSEKRKSLVANKVEERKVEMDKAFQSMQRVVRTNVDEIFVKLGFEKKKREARGKEQKHKKTENINERVKPVEVDMFHKSSRASERTRRRGGGGNGSAVRRDRSLGFNARGQYGGGHSNAQQLRTPHVEDLSQFPPLRQE